MPDWDPYLIRELARRRVVPVIGAGASKHATGNGGVRPPLWAELMEDCIAANANCPPAIRDAVENHDLLHAAEWLRDHLGGEHWRTYLRTKFVTPNYRFSELHTQMAKLDQRIFFSLNFDAIFERAAVQEFGDTLTVKNYHDDDISQIVTGDLRYLVYVHGSKNSFDKVIIANQDYAKVRNDHGHFYKIVDAVIQTHSLLFIGCGVSDPDFNLLLENHSFGSPSDESRLHYRLTHESKPELEKSLKRNRRIQTIHYDPVDENHSGLVDAIKELNEMVDQRRDQLKVDANW